MKQPIKMTPGDDLHLTALMAPFSLNLVTGEDRKHLLGYGRAAFDAGKDSAGKCLLQIQEPAPVQAAPAVVAVPDVSRGLLEALESMVDVCEIGDFDGAPSDAHMDKARAAISAYRTALAAPPCSRCEAVSIRGRHGRSATL